MRKVCVFVLVCGVILGGLGTWALSSAEARDKPTTRPARPTRPPKDSKTTGNGPVDVTHLQQAIVLLQQARATALSSPHKFGGHRRNAVKDIDHAIHQLQQALRHNK
jgi:hypothetical protein